MVFIEQRLKMRKYLVNKVLGILRKTGLPDYILGFLLKGLHFHTPWYFFIYFLLFSKKKAVYATIPLIIAFVLFITLNGCFISIIEKKLLKENNRVNIIDPFILLFGDDITPTTRYWYTIGISLIYGLIISIILYCRGCFSSHLWFDSE